MELETMVRLLEGLIRQAWPEVDEDEEILAEAEIYVEELKQLKEALNG